MKVFKYIFTTMAFIIGLAACGGGENSSQLREEWDYWNAPFHLVPGFNANFDSLPLEAELAEKPWSDSYWPSYRGGLADRWQDYQSPSAFKMELYTGEKLAGLSTEELTKLSPAEKYDLLVGRTDYPLTTSEINRTDPENPGWWGLCHGWAAAAMNFVEPRAVVMANEDGLDIPFTSSDIKALLTYFQQDDDVYTRVQFLGGRCNSDLDENPDDATNPECKDVNAGSFHLALTNKIALQDKAFVADIQRDLEVWNHPIYGYHSEVLETTDTLYETAAPNTVKIVKMRTTMNYVTEISARAEPQNGTDIGQYVTKAYVYWLEIDKDGDVIGGEWDHTRRPDFLWAQSKPEFSGFFEELGELYQLATK